MTDSRRSTRPKVALLPWGDLIEDFLDTIRVSFESFRDELSGGWLFGYVDALREVGVETVLVCVSARVERAARHRHAPTGVPIWLLPASRAHVALRRRIPRPYAWTLEEAFGPNAVRKRGLGRALRAIARDVSPYLATPPRLLATALAHEGCRAILVQEYEYPRFDVSVAVGRLLGLPAFGIFQGGDFQVSRLERHVRPHSIRACAGLIVGSSREVERVCARYGVPQERIARIFNPIDAARWTPVSRSEAREAIGIPGSATVAVWHGRIDIHPKGLDVLVEAWRMLCQDQPGRDLRLLLVGTGPDADAFRKLLAEPGLPGVRWVDEYVRDRGEMQRYLAAGDVGVMTSRHEGLPVAPVEAMACGLPLVSSDASGIRDILAGGEESGGLVVPVEDPGAIAHALGRLVDDPELRCALGARARLSVETRFSLQATGEELLAFLTRRGARWQSHPEPAS